MSVFNEHLFLDSLQKYLHAAFFTNATAQVEDPEHTGSGIDDLSTGGTYTPPSTQKTTKYKVQIDGTGTPDTFKWSDDGGTTWDAEAVSITGGSQTLNNDVTIVFTATTGHTSGDYWIFYATPATGRRVYIVESFDAISFQFCVAPCYAITDGPHDHSRPPDCRTGYTFQIGALQEFLVREKNLVGQKPYSRYFSALKMIADLKPYLSLPTLRPGIQTYYSQSINQGRWIGVDKCNIYTDPLQSRFWLMKALTYNCEIA